MATRLLADLQRSWFVADLDYFTARKCRSVMCPDSATFSFSSLIGVLLYNQPASFAMRIASSRLRAPTLAMAFDR